MTDERTVAGEQEATPATGFVLGLAVAAFLVVLLGLRPALVNLHGPFGEHALVGMTASLVVAGCCAVLLGWLGWLLGRRSTWALVGYAVALGAVAVVLFPASVDQHESFVEQPNDRSSCLGVSFLSYPPGTMDASDEVYCVGLERPLPAG